MEDKESGSLSQTSVLDLVVELYKGAVTGSLKLDRAPLQKAIFFRDGQILFAHSNDPKDQLASILVEEGKLGPDQMQVAQGRVSPGNPLAKVLTDLGYISQRELADSARIKVEKILTDLYTWNDGSYQFVTKSLKVAIADLGLSSEQLIYTSICRVQDRDWVLEQLGALDAVLAPGPQMERFVADAKPTEDALEILNQVDGVKTVQQVGALSSLGEFEVCKILAAALVLGGLTKAGAPGLAAGEDAFDIPVDAPAIPSPDVADENPFGGLETVGMDTSAPGFTEGESPSDTVFQAADNAPFDSPDTVFSQAADLSSPEPELAIPAAHEASVEDFASPEPEAPEPETPELSFGEPADDAPPGFVIGEPEVDEEADQDEYDGYEDDEPALATRVAPRSKRQRGGGGGMPSIVKLAAVVALAAGAAYAAFTFVWPMVGGGGTTSAPASTQQATPTPPADTSATPGGTDTAASAAGTAPPPKNARPTPAPSSAAAANNAPPPAAVTSAPAETTPRPAPPPSTRPRPAAASTSTPPAARAGGSGGGRQLLAGGDLPGAASAFRSELRATAVNQFTIAVGLYCSAENAGRVVRNAGSSEQIFVLPANVQGRSCYRIVWGTYDSKQTAENSIGSLPAGIRAGDSAAVPLARVLR